MKQLLVLLLIIIVHLSFGQTPSLTENSQISVITIEPGKYLVDSFGHSAFRVKDEALGIDQAYNYGTYDFNKPNFYLNFAKGKLEYDLSSYPFHYLVKGYTQENRSITEQILDLSLIDKQRFFNFLENNAKPENKSYLYDFLYDNCATKLPEVSKHILKDKITLSYEFDNDKNFTFRDLIHKYLDEQPWGKFGIDLALGSVIDKKAEPKEYIFLPDYVLESYKKATIKNSEVIKPLVSETNNLFTSKQVPKKQILYTPLVVFSLLVLTALWFTYHDYKKNARSKWLDFIIFFITGFIGLLLVLLWFATDHTATGRNFNILWAFAPNLLVSFFLLKTQIELWIKYYILFLIILLVIMIILWILKIQVFSIAIVPILLLLVLRYFYLLRKPFI